MSHNTLSQSTSIVFANGARKAPVIQSNRSASLVMWLMLALVFGPMIAIHIGIRLTAPLESPAVEYATATTLVSAHK